MAIRSTITLAGTLSLAVLAAVLAGCGRDTTGPTPPSLAPETELTYAPLQGDTAGFRVHLFWNGYDRDGEVMRFHYAIDTDTLEIDRAKWKSTISHDTTLLLLVDPAKGVGRHVFWISAEDNDGNIDPTPAKRFFSTKTIPPVSNIVRGPATFNPLVPPTFRFDWEGIDPDGSDAGGPAPCDSFEMLLLRIGTVNDPTKQPPHEPLPSFNYTFYVNLINASIGDTLADSRYSDWRWNGIRAKGVRMSDTPPGEYVFALRAVDVAGAKEKGLALVRNIGRVPGRVEKGSGVIFRSCHHNNPAFGPETGGPRHEGLYQGRRVA
jgi:hypothetical protein